MVLMHAYYDLRRIKESLPERRALSEALSRNLILSMKNEASYPLRENREVTTRGVQVMRHTSRLA